MVRVVEIMRLLNRFMVSQGTRKESFLRLMMRASSLGSGSPLTSTASLIVPSSSPVGSSMGIPSISLMNSSPKRGMTHRLREFDYNYIV